MSDALFETGKFVLHSGSLSSFRIDAAALNEDDLYALAVQVASRFRWRKATGVPRGGLRFAKTLDRFSVPCIDLPELIVDDVFTTGASIENQRRCEPSYRHDHIGVVIFARAPTPDWVHPIFAMWPPGSK